MGESDYEEEEEDDENDQHERWRRQTARARKRFTDSRRPFVLEVLFSTCLNKYMTSLAVVSEGFSSVQSHFYIYRPEIILLL